jgi:cytoskeletal protein CcmA (bactofilin family)
MQSPTRRLGVTCSQRRGASLATVMMVVAMMMTLAFTVVAIAFNHLNLSFKNSNNSRARHLAEATLAVAVDKLVKDQEYGMYGGPEDKTVRVTMASLPAGSEGVLSFDPSTASGAGVPYSTNNRSEAAVSGAGNKLVPGESFHLVARGQVKNSFSTVEAIVTVPKFPFSVAAQGAIRSSGGLVVASVKPGVPYDLRYPIHEDDLEAGHLVSNSKAGNDAVVLSGENKIYGDLQSASGVTIEEDTAVLGEIRTDSGEESLPKIDASNYDPELEAGLQTVNSGAGKLEVEGYNKSYGDLTVDNGIVLNGGVLYVEGDLQVSAGGVSGKGALVATGDITVYGDGEAASDKQAALIADGDILLRGSTSEKARFAGLIYTNGKLKAENMRLAGVFVAAGTDSDVEFQNTEVYEDSSRAKIDISREEVFALPAISPPAMGFDGKMITATYDTTELVNNLESYRNPSEDPGQPDYLFKFASVASSTGYFTHQYSAGGTSLVETPGPDPYVLDGAAFGLKIFGQDVNSEAEAENVAVAELEAQFLAEGRVLTQTEKNAIRTSARIIYASGSAAYYVSVTSANFSQVNAPGGPGGGTTGFRWSLDMSDFYNQGEHMKVFYWADYHEE